MTLFKNWGEDEKNLVIRITGLLIGAFALFATISCISYLFNWKADMSELASSLADGANIGNHGGSLGMKLSALLVCKLFGLGAFALLVIPFAISIRMTTRKVLRNSIIKITLASSSATVILSLALAFTGLLTGMANPFGGGLGGECGSFTIDWIIGQVGTIATGAFIAVFIISWLFLSSKRFTAWFASIWDRKKEDMPEKLEQACPEVEEIIPVEILQDEPANETAEETDTLPDSDGPSESEPSADDGGFEIITDPDGLDTTVSEPLKPIDNRLDPPDGLPRYKFPSLNLLADYEGSRKDVPTVELTRNNNKIRAALLNYRIEVTDVKAIVGPTVTLYKVYPAPGVQIAQIKRLQEDIALSLNAKGVRVITLSDSVGIEVANDFASTVPIKALLNDAAFRESKAELPVAIGYTIQQKVKVFDLADAPHLLIAGATKQGKSVGLNIIINSLLYSKHPSELKFVFIDPKMVEFSAYSQLHKHYLAVLPEADSEEDERSRAIVKRPKDAERILRSLCVEMDDRYELLSRAGVNKITAYNEKYKDRHLLPSKGHRYLPYLVCVVDEYADLTMTVGASPETKAASKSITNSIIRLAQKGRAAGIHVILATQRPSVDVISGIIKSNFPMRIAFRVASRIDSMTILDAPGAEKLIGRGDMLFSAGIESERIQCGFVSSEEIDKVTDFIGEQTGVNKCYNTAYYLPDVSENNSESGGVSDMGDIDERFSDAAQLVVTTQKASTSFLQTRLGMGFAKAARVMGQLETAGIVGPQDGAKPRQVLVPDLNSLQPILDSFVK